MKKLRAARLGGSFENMKSEYEIYIKSRKTKLPRFYLETKNNLPKLSDNKIKLCDGSTSKQERLKS